MGVCGIALPCVEFIRLGIVWSLQEVEAVMGYSACIIRNSPFFLSCVFSPLSLPFIVCVCVCILTDLSVTWTVKVCSCAFESTESYSLRYMHHKSSNNPPNPLNITQVSLCPILQETKLRITDEASAVPLDILTYPT